MSGGLQLLSRYRAVVEREHTAAEMLVEVGHLFLGESDARKRIERLAVGLHAVDLHLHGVVEIAVSLIHEQNQLHAVAHNMTVHLLHEALVRQLEIRLRDKLGGERRLNEAARLGIANGADAAELTVVGQLLKIQRVCARSELECGRDGRQLLARLNNTQGAGRFGAGAQQAAEAQKKCTGLSHRHRLFEDESRPKHG